MGHLVGGQDDLIYYILQFAYDISLKFYYKIIIVLWQFYTFK